MKIIINPTAGRGRMQARAINLEDRLLEKGIRAEFLETQRPGHAFELAKAAAESGVGQVCVAGGDGSISEVVNALVGSNVELGIIALGTGNDVARSLGLPINQPEAALDVILNGKVRAIDVGVGDGRYFISLIGVGFPALVASQANQMRRVHGPLTFFLSVYRAVLRMKAHPVRIELDDRELKLRCTSILIQNTPYTGGGLLMAPQAEMDDGLLDVVVVGDIGRLDLMLNFPRVYRGTHLNHSKFSGYRSRCVKVESESPLEVILDGDLMGTVPLSAGVLQKALKVRVS